jgi:hypothetical protein
MEQYDSMGIACVLVVHVDGGALFLSYACCRHSDACFATDKPAHSAEEVPVLAHSMV